MEILTKKYIKKAFTLTETLTVLIIIAFLATIMVTSLSSSLPDKERAMFKKAYSITEKNIAELVSDETLYPYDVLRQGFLNTDCVQIPGEATQVGQNCSASVRNSLKFCQLFKSKLNIIAEWDDIDWVNPTTTCPKVDEPTDACEGQNVCDTSDTIGINSCRFQTSDGLIWYIDGEFSAGDTEVLVKLDVLPDNNDNEPLVIRVSSNGKIRLEEGCAGDFEKSILRSDSVTNRRN